MKDDVVVRACRRALVIKRPALLPAFLKNMERAGHAEMHDQHVAGGQSGEQIFRAPAEAVDGPALEPLREMLRQRPAQVARGEARPARTRALHRRLKAAAYGLDFGKFGHRSITAPRRANEYGCAAHSAAGPPRYCLSEQA